MKFDQRYVAFMDILGFSNIVRSLPFEADANRLKQIVDALENAGSRDKSLDVLFDGDIKYQAFSDSIVMSCSVGKTELQYLLYAVGELVQQLLTSSLLVRGGIAKGLLHHQNNVMFGPAFLEAYRLECSIAQYPRVVLGREVYADFIEHGSPGRVRLGDDGPPFLDVFYALHELNMPDGKAKNVAQVAEAKLWRGNLQRLIDSARFEPRHYEKLRWIATYWNTTVLAHGDIGTVQF